MCPLNLGDVAPPVPGVSFDQGPIGLFFYKVTCPTCTMVAPKMQMFEHAFPGRVVGVGQDPQSVLDRYSTEHEMGIRTIEDVPPYPVSDAFAIESVPTLYLLDGERRVLESVGAWDRAGFNAVADGMAQLMGVAPVMVSTPDDGLPDFKPG